ncbi:uracil-DNA glycosylase family protein [Rhodococcus phenolicus]|uniref:uracil-DNA glycosylase family protein n=1 Tax=Rhodococcus phenolicus TaxID=263849 RepID=UPI0012E79BCD|nr:uracil-DNA glycosylase family protein [Rhodococcus phenolicus]
MSSPGYPSSARALKDDALRLQRIQQAKVAPSVVELNRLVWRISEREKCTDRLPYLDPTYGGVDADVILLLKAPQADADPDRGPARLISLDNDDRVAATLFDLFRELGIDRRRCVAWNICPFPIDKFDPDDDEFVRGREDFRAFVDLIRHPKTVLVLGAKVRDGWRAHSFGAVTPGTRVVFGPSPSPPGINQPGRRDELRSALRDAFEPPTR